MSDGYVLAGYGVTVATLALYAARVLRRERSLARAMGAGPDVAAPADGGPEPAGGPGGSG